MFCLDILLRQYSTAPCMLLSNVFLLTYYVCMLGLNPYEFLVCIKDMLLSNVFLLTYYAWGAFGDSDVPQVTPL